VILIRYLELSGGLHGAARPAGRSTTIYLRPGLTGAQRGAVLRRLRQESRVGCGPLLPAGQLAAAIAADRIRTAVSRVVAVLRLHPAVILVPPLLLGATAGLLIATLPPGAPGQHGPAGVSPGLVARVISGSRRPDTLLCGGAYETFRGVYEHDQSGQCPDVRR
jgi:hypothetical protein